MRIRNRLANLLRLQSQQAYAAVVVLLSVSLVVATLATGGRSALAASGSRATTTTAKATTTTAKATTTTAKATTTLATTTTAKATTTTLASTTTARPTTTTGSTTTTTARATTTTCPPSSTSTTAKTTTTKKGATTTTAKATTTTAKVTTTTAAGVTTTTGAVNPCSTTTTTAPATVALSPNAVPRTGTFTTLTISNCPLNSDVTVMIIKNRSQFEILWAGKAPSSGVFTLSSIEAPDNFTPGIYEVQLACGGKTASTFVTIMKAPGPSLTKPGPYGPTAALGVAPDPVQMGTTLSYVFGQECARFDTVVLYIIRNRKNYYALGTTTANSSGYFVFDGTIAVTIPTNISPGNYVLTAKCISSGAFIDYTLRVTA